MNSIYHKGELAVQKLAGESRMAQLVGRNIKTRIHNGAIPFIEQQPMAILGSIDNQGQLWASLLLGEYGFIKVPDPQTVLFDPQLLRSSQKDIFFQNIQSQNQVGALFIDPSTRRRYRSNGSISPNSKYLQLNIKEAYPNCPKFIQKAQIILPKQAPQLITRQTYGQTLGPTEQAWISNAHTFYIATSGQNGKVDASHRGGNAGFIDHLPDGRLRIPDYPGNNMFSTLGNIYENPNAGLLFIDFEKGETLQLTGQAQLQVNQHSTTDLEKSGETGRFLIFKPTSWIRMAGHHRVGWKFLEYSPFNVEIPLLPFVKP